MDKHATPMLRSIAVVALCVAAGGCGLTDPESEIVYELGRVNGRNLPTPVWPAVVSAPTPQPVWQMVAIVSGKLTFSADGSCRRTIVADIPARANRPEIRGVERSWDCTWIRGEEDLHMEWIPGLDDFPFVTDVSDGLINDADVLLIFDRGIRCVTTPCPAGWAERYRTVSR